MYTKTSLFLNTNFVLFVKDIPGGVDLLFDGIRGCAAQMAGFISVSSVKMGVFWAEFP